MKDYKNNFIRVKDIKITLDKEKTLHEWATDTFNSFTIRLKDLKNNKYKISSSFLEIKGDMTAMDNKNGVLGIPNNFCYIEKELLYHRHNLYVTIYSLSKEKHKEWLEDNFIENL